MARCNHPSSKGVDHTPLENPRKVWHCCTCGEYHYEVTGENGLSFNLPAPDPTLRAQLAARDEQVAKLKAALRESSRLAHKAWDTRAMDTTFVIIAELADAALAETADA